MFLKEEGSSLKSRNLIKTHGKSYYLASFFFTRDVRYDIADVYDLFRTADDIVDECPELASPIKKKLLLSQLKTLKMQNAFTQIKNVNSLIQQMPILICLAS